MIQCVCVCAKCVSCCRNHCALCLCYLTNSYLVLILVLLSSSSSAGEGRGGDGRAHSSRAETRLTDSGRAAQLHLDVPAGNCGGGSGLEEEEEGRREEAASVRPSVRGYRGSSVDICSDARCPTLVT